MRKKLESSFGYACDLYRRRLQAEGRMNEDAERRIRTFEEEFGKYPISEVDTQAIQDFLYRQYAGAKPATVNRNLAVLIAILHLAHDEGHLLVVPRVRRFKGASQRDVHLELEEIMPVVDHIREEMGALAGFVCLLLVDTGARWGEACNIRWGDIRPDWIRIRGSSGVNSKTLPRQIPTSPRLLQYMVEYAIRPMTTDSSDTPIIASRWNSHMRGIGKVMNNAVKRASIATGASCGADITLHDLRHTFAFMCASAGADVADIKDLLGHTSIQMTMRYRGFVKSRAAAIVREAMKSVPRSGITGLEGVKHD